MKELAEISAEIEEKKNEIISLGGEVTPSETTSTTTNQPITSATSDAIITSTAATPSSTIPASTMQPASTPTPSTNVSDEYLLWISDVDGIPRLGRHAYYV